MVAKKKSASDRKRNDAHRNRQAKISRDRSASTREVGPLPERVNLKRWKKCGKSLKLFMETYFAERFLLAWSDDQLKVIAKLQDTILRGGSNVIVMPRGSGKTTLCEVAAIWAIAYGYRRFVVLIGATAEAATDMLDSIKMEIETNDELAADFPELCHCVRALDGIVNRANGQTLNGERTRIRWTHNEIVLPTVEGSVASGSRIRVAGITGRIRGMKATTADGKSIRPDLAIADDPQTDDSASSTIQTDKRERILKGAAKGLAGPGKTIAILVPCTVIEQGDLSDRLLDRERNPQFTGERQKMLYSMPSNLNLWDEYASLRRDSARRGGHGEEATEFYRANQAEMDAGSIVAWPARFDPDHEISALQAAMNLYLDNPWEFAAEYQGDPRSVDENQAAIKLDAKALALRTVRVPRLTVPSECTRLTAFIDLGGQILWYVIVAWDERFSGTVIDYGCWPQQARQMFIAREPKPSLGETYKGLSEEQRVFAGLRDLTTMILSRRYLRHGTDEVVTVDRCLVDEGWNPDVAYEACRDSAFASVLMPSKGRGGKPGGTPMSQWSKTKKQGVRYSPPGQPTWIIGPVGSGKGRHATVDVDAWKTFTANRLLTEPGGGGCLRFFSSGKDGEHELFIKHLVSEFAAEVTTPDGATFAKWGRKPNLDNHWWDCLVGCAVAASMQGLIWSADASGAAKPPKKAKRKLADLVKTKAREPANRDPADEPVQTPAPRPAERVENDPPAKKQKRKLSDIVNQKMGGRQSA